MSRAMSHVSRLLADAGDGENSYGEDDEHFVSVVFSFRIRVQHLQIALYLSTVLKERFASQFFLNSC